MSPGSLFNDNAHNGAFCLLSAYWWHIKYGRAGFSWLLLFLRDFPDWDGASEDCLQANGNIWLSGRRRETGRSADGNVALLLTVPGLGP